MRILRSEYRPYVLLCIFEYAHTELSDMEKTYSSGIVKDTYLFLNIRRIFPIPKKKECRASLWRL